ncbi:hypothetical protein ONZ45_g5923 [Pleurotus djamor]|nr:hypothetical protein ONZ45_g5923 [Pleurotus djamor]
MLSIPQEQTALLFKAFGKPFELGSRPVPKPSSKEVLVKVESTALNPIDWKAQRYDVSAGFGFKYPAVAGMDGAGFVAEIPDSMPFAEASTIPLCLTTAAFGLYCAYDHLKTGGAGLKPFWEEGGRSAYKGTPILVIGGASSVGQFVIQVAKYQGFSPILTTASLKHTDYLVGLGADQVFDRHADLASELQNYSPDIRIPYVYDAVNMPIPDDVVDVLAPGGTLICILPISNELDLTGDKKAVSTLASTAHYPSFGRALYRCMPQLIAEGVFKPSRVIEVEGGLAGINGALERLENNQISGHKLVVFPPETGPPRAHDAVTGEQDMQNSKAQPCDIAEKLYDGMRLWCVTLASTGHPWPLREECGVIAPAAMALRERLKIDDDGKLPVPQSLFAVSAIMFALSRLFIALIILSFTGIECVSALNAHPVHLAKVYTKCTVPNTVALTFDDGPSSYQPVIVKALRTVNAKGTFFVSGNYMAIRRILGVKPAFVRPPLGMYNDLVREVAAKHGLKIANTDFAPDPELPLADILAAYDALISQHPDTILRLHEAGYKLVTISECLGERPYQWVGKPQAKDVSFLEVLEG